MSTGEQDYTYLLGLARMREILVIDRDHMLAGKQAALAQRADVLSAVESAIDVELRMLTGVIPDSSSGPPSDTITEAAWTYLHERRPQQAAGSQGSPSAYDQLKAVFAEHGKIGEAQAVLNFVEQANFPGKESWYPAEEALATILENAFTSWERAKNKILADETVGPLLASARALRDDLPPVDQRNLDLMYELWIQSNGLPPDLSARRQTLNQECREAFQNAKDQNKMTPLIKPLDALMVVLRRESKILAKLLKISPYDAFLRVRKTGVTTEDIKRIFPQLKVELPPLISSILQHQAQEHEVLPLPSVPINVQQRVVMRLLQAMGTDPNTVTLGQAGSGGSFAEGSWDDVRVVIDLQEDDFLKGIMGTIHELGHAGYFAGLPRENKYQPVAQWGSNALHEMMSMFCERGLASSLLFMEWLSGVVQEELSKEPTATIAERADDKAFDPSNLYRKIMRVDSSEKRRIKAHFVLYPLHVMVQSFVEVGLLNGRLKAKTVSPFRTRLMRKFLGVDTRGDVKLGAAQDPHLAWNNSFPQYVMGLLGAIQLWAAYEKSDPHVDDKIRSGELKPIIAWLKSNIYSKGSIKTTDELLQAATGEGLSAQPFLAMVRNRFPEAMARGPAPKAPPRHARGTRELERLEAA